MKLWQRLWHKHELDLTAFDKLKEKRFSFLAYAPCKICGEARLVSYMPTLKMLLQEEATRNAPVD